MIDVNNLVKRYGSVTAVDHLSFRVEKGQIYGFLGPNGAGKSTTINMITGYISATEGSVHINGFDVAKEPEKAKAHIGYLPEIPPVYPDMTPDEYLSFAGELKRIPGNQISNEVKRVMELTGVTSMRKRLICNLSKGYRQRVGFACALLGNPEVIILDEPTVGLDPKQMIEIRNLIRSLRGEHTVILSSHILSEVSAVCDHVLIISKGKLVAGDRPEHLSSLMKKTNSYQLLIQGGEETVYKALREISDIRKIETMEVSSGLTSVRLETEADRDPREDVFRKLASIDCPIMELTSKVMSLEDIFLELTDDAHNVQEKDQEVNP